MYASLFALAFAAIAAAQAPAAEAANTVQFVSKDATSRTVYFVPNAGLEWLEPINVGPGATVSQTFPTGWVGNFYAQCEGFDLGGNGMLGEIQFQGWNGLTYFDVSAIVNPTDMTGVHMLYPASGADPVAGCSVFPCDRTYYQPNDLQTWTTTETSFICELADNSGQTVSKRDQAAADGPHLAFGRDVFRTVAKA